jgi:hypothetical protein
MKKRSQEIVNGWFKKSTAGLYADVSAQTITKWIASGLEHSILPSGLVLIHKDSLDVFIQGFAVTGNEVSQIADGIVKELMGR